MIRLQERAAVLNILLEEGAGNRANDLADKIIDALFPPEWEGYEKLERCLQCGGKGHVTIVIDHGNNSHSYYDVLCGKCYGTGKLSEVVIDGC